MSELRIYDENNPNQPLAVYTREEEIRAALKPIGVEYERWQANKPLDNEATQDEVIEAYRDSIDRLMKTYGYQTVDVVSMYPNHPQREAMRSKFLAEHTHADAEVRFFVDGEGLFNLRKDGKVYSMLCMKSDLLSVPPGIAHWFDTGERPNFKAIRLFTTPEGWVATFTGDKIADRFPRLERPHYEVAA